MKSIQQYSTSLQDGQNCRENVDVDNSAFKAHLKGFVSALEISMTSSVKNESN
jgi:hypothetical protein